MNEVQVLTPLIEYKNVASTGIPETTQLDSIGTILCPDHKGARLASLDRLEKSANLRKRQDATFK